MFNMNRCYNLSIVLSIVPPILDQTCTFQYIIPMGNLKKIDRRGHASPSGLLSLAPCRTLTISNVHSKLSSINVNLAKIIWNVPFLIV